MIHLIFSGVEEVNASYAIDPKELESKNFTTTLKSPAKKRKTPPKEELRKASEKNKTEKKAA